MSFLDTTIWVSAIDASDGLHRDGKAVLEALVEGRISSAMTTDFVLDAALTILKNRGAGLDDVAKIVRNILSSRLVLMRYVDESTFKEALSNFEKYKSLSFTDAVTLTIMNRYRIREIYSHDKDFDLKGIIRRERS